MEGNEKYKLCEGETKENKKETSYSSFSPYSLFHPNDLARWKEAENR